MKLALTMISISFAIAGCAGAAPRREAAHWDDSPATSSGVDAGVDAGGPVDAGPAPGLALFQRSCTPCHTRTGSTDPYAVRGGIFFETEADFRRWAAAESIGTTQSSLAEVLSLRADGLDLIVGTTRLPMPPRASAYPPFTAEEARTALTWLRTQR